MKRRYIALFCAVFLAAIFLQVVQNTSQLDSVANAQGYNCGSPATGTVSCNSYLGTIRCNFYSAMPGASLSQSVSCSNSNGYTVYCAPTYIFGFSVDCPSFPIPYVPPTPTPTPYTFYTAPTPAPFTYHAPTPSYTYSYPIPSYTYSYPIPSYSYSYPTPTASAVTNNNVQTLNQLPDRGHSAGTATAVYQLFTQSRPAPIGLLVETPSTCSANGDSTYINFLSPGTCNVLVTSFATDSLPIVSKLLSLTVLPSTLPSLSPVLITPQEVELPKVVTNSAKPKTAAKVSKKQIVRKK